MVNKYLILLAPFLGLVLLLTWLHSSLWFLWFLLPVGNTQLALNNNVPVAAQTQLAKLLSPEIVEFIPATRRFAVSRSGEQIVFAGLPRHQTKTNLRRDLKAAGWQTNRLGAVIIARRQTCAASPCASRPHASAPLAAAKETLKALLLPSLPTAPAAITAAANGTLPYLSEPIAALATLKGRELQIQIGPHLAAITSETPAPFTAPDVSILSLALPSRYFEHLTPELKTSWNQALLDRFFFSKTTPNFLPALNDSSFLSLLISTDQAGIASQGNPEHFVAHLSQVIENEEIYLRPQENTFRLPDGTVGFETIPGNPRPLFQGLEPGTCRQEISLWLCQNESGVALSSSLQTAEELLASLSNWRLNIGADFLTTPPFSIFQSVSAFGHENYLTINATLK